MKPSDLLQDAPPPPARRLRKLATLDLPWPSETDTAFALSLHEPAVFVGGYAITIASNVIARQPKPQIYMRLVWLVNAAPDAIEVEHRFGLVGMTPKDGGVAVQTMATLAEAPDPTLLALIGNPVTGLPVAVFETPLMELEIPKTPARITSV